MTIAIGGKAKRLKRQARLERRREHRRKSAEGGWCIWCTRWFPWQDLTSAFACSYLCLPCADRMHDEIAAL